MHTPAPPVDVAALVPAVAPYARMGTRLHPRRGTPGADTSHIGGAIRWPADEPWPWCSADLPADDEVSVPQLGGGFLAVKRLPGMGSRPLPHPQPNPMMVVAQLRAVDVPGLWHPPGVDVLQLLWCPFDHPQEHGDTPVVRLFWRRHDLQTPVAAPPTGLADDRFYLPRPCLLSPEQVIEYPDREDLPDELLAQIEVQIEALGEPADYAGQLSTAPGWKVGGWPQWSVTGRCLIDCDRCARAMDLLLTIDTSEHGGGRWQPVGEHDSGDEHARREPTGIVVGRWGTLQIFICTRCPDHPVRLNLQ